MADIQPGLAPGMEGAMLAEKQRNEQTLNALNMISSIQQGRTNALQYETAQRAFADDQSVRNALMDPSIGGDTGKAANALMNKGLYKQALELRKGDLENRKSQATISKDEAETHIKHLGVIGGALSPLRGKQDLSLDDVRGALSDIAAQGTPRDVVASIASTVPQDPRMLQPWLDSVLMRTEHGQKTFQAYQPKVELKEVAGPDGRPVIAPMNTNALAGGLGLIPNAPTANAPVKLETRDRGGYTEATNPYTAQPVPGTQVNKTMTPGEAAVNALGLQRLAQDKTQVVTDGNGNITLVDKRTATGRPVMDATGQPMQGRGGNLNEHQGKATAFAMRMTDSNKVISELEKPGSNFDPASVSAQLAGHTGASAPLNYLASPDAQKYEQAKRNWVTANLRLESGAAIPDPELAQEYRKWFPIPGDGPAVVKQKMESRKVAEQAMRVQAGPGAKQIPNAAPANPAAPVTRSLGGKTYVKQNGQWYEQQ